MEKMSDSKQKVNHCFACGKVDFSTEHHVKELNKEYTVELCQKCHFVLNHYYEEALPKLTQFLAEKNKNQTSSMKKLQCYRCGQEIYFDPDRKSESGKSIPLDAATDEPHVCPNSNFKPSKSLAQEIKDSEERGRERIRKTSYV